MTAFPVMTRRLLLCASAAALTACGVVGKGNAPTSIAIAPHGGTASSSVRAYQCIAGTLDPIVTFTDGTVVNYSGTNKNVVWSSSNPSVVSIDSASGAITPQAVGSATITATLYSLTATATVNVGTLSPSDISFHKVDQEDLSQTVDSTNGLTISTNTSSAAATTYDAVQYLALVANEGTSGNQVLRNITGGATYSLTDANGTAVPSTDVLLSMPSLSVPAELSSPTAIYPLPVVALTPGSTPTPSGSPDTLTATLDACANPIKISVPLSVANIDALSLQPEKDPASGATQLGYVDGSNNLLPLIRGNTERFKLVASFAGTTNTQDLSLFGTYASSDPTVANFDYYVTNGADIISTLNSTAAGTTTVSATFDDGSASAPIASNTLSLTTEDGTLQSIAISPLTGTVTATSDIDSAKFYAIGSFAVGNTTVMQDVSRLATFASDTPALATVTTNPIYSSGLAGPANFDNASNIAGGTAMINASISSGGTTPTTLTAPTAATLTVKPQPDAATP